MAYRQLLAYKPGLNKLYAEQFALSACRLGDEFHSTESVFVLQIIDGFELGQGPLAAAIESATFLLRLVHCCAKFSG